MRILVLNCFNVKAKYVVVSEIIVKTCAIFVSVLTQEMGEKTVAL